MLVTLSATEHQAHCERCGRDSPVVAGSEADGAKRFEELGWMKANAEEWRCPVCCSRISGDWSSSER
jgi:hypothetical protein